MAMQIPILAVIFLGERLNGREVLGLVIAILGTLLVQLGRRGDGVTRRRGGRAVNLKSSIGIIPYSTLSIKSCTHRSLLR